MHKNVGSIHTSYDEEKQFRPNLGSVTVGHSYFKSLVVLVYFGSMRKEKYICIFPGA